MKPYKNFFYFIAGIKTNPSSPDSNWRRIFGRICIGTVFLFLLEAILVSFDYIADEKPIPAAFAGSIMSIWFFIWVVCMPPFIHKVGVNASRLLWDTVASSILMIAVFALWYRILGLEMPDGQKMFSALDALYFSAVTFSTLGFGDFSPKPNAQVFAAVQALLGNIHLGFIVGATFSAAQADKS
tara:strand:- start:3975 stop:4526 length:552 start_codon:yes stop_codon:yes gene_type:complete